MSRKELLKLSGCVFILITHLVTALTAVADPYVSPYLSFVSDPSSSITISWIEISDEGREVSLTPTEQGHSTPNPITSSNPDVVVEGATTYYCHHVTFTGLDENTEYEYEVEGYSEYNQCFRTGKSYFETGDAFVIYGDTRSGVVEIQGNEEAYYTYHPEIALAIMNYPENTMSYPCNNPSPPLFALNVGDLANIPRISPYTPPNQNRGYLKYDFFDPLIAIGSAYPNNPGQWYRQRDGHDSHMIDTRPVLTCLGNHDGDGVLYSKVLELPKNNPNETELYYSFDYGYVHFVILNTEPMIEEWGPTAQQGDQLDWLGNDLASNQSQPYRIVMYHRPHYYDEGQYFQSNMNTYWRPVFQTYHVQAVFSGHKHHYYEHLENDGIHYVVTGGGGAPLYYNVNPVYVSEYSYTRLEYENDERIHIIPLDYQNNILQFSGNNLDFYIEPYIPPSHYLSGNRSGTLEEGFYLAVGNITVPTGTTLNIEPGTRIFFADDDYRINVYGTLVAVGTEDKLIKFLPKYGVDEWGGIYFYSNSSNNSLEYCHIYDAGIAIHLSSAGSVNITDCYFKDVGIGVHDINSSVNISNTLMECEIIGIYNNINSSGENVIDIQNSSFLGDNSGPSGIYLNGCGHGVTLNLEGHLPNKPTISGFDIGVECYNATVNFDEGPSIYTPNNVIISGNSGWGAYLSNCANSSLTHTDFDENGYYGSQEDCGGLYLYATSPEIEKCYFTYNYGYAAYAENGSDAIFGEYDNSHHGNEFKNNAPTPYTDYGIIHEAGDSYPLFNERYNNLYLGNFTHFIYNEDLDVERVVDYNYWGTANGPEEDDFYPVGNYWWTPFCSSPNGIGQSTDGKGGGAGDDLGDGLETGIALEKLGEYQRAVDSYRDFVSASEDVVRRKVALRRMLSASINGGLNLDSLLACYQSIARTAAQPAIGRSAAGLQTRVREAMEDYEQAIRDYENLLLSRPEYEDSVYAVIEAGRAHLLLKERNGGVRGSFQPQIPQLEPRNWEEYIAHRKALLAELHRYRRTRIAGETPGGLAAAELPSSFTLHRNSPNPFNPSTRIRYDLPELSEVKLEIFNITGRKVITLVDGWEPAGYRSVMWNGSDDSGRAVSSGIYLYRITALGQSSGTKFIQSDKMMLLK